ncbi:YidC/Oxa1 family membrane protein insertase [Candidatus Beckwithbacteria bacterium]|nr:YidC/Oxa1 family membrane protein insertase [Candidatus Beckwithbacteria bacterium]
MNIWYLFLYQPLVNILIFAYLALGNNLGLAIIAITVLIRIALVPLTKPSMDSAAKMQQLQPEIAKLKEQYKDDKQGLAQAQMDLYKKYNINPFGGLVPVIVQFVILIALFQAFNNVLKTDIVINELNGVLYPFLKLAENIKLNTNFLYLDLTKPDVFPLPFKIGPLAVFPGFFLILAAVSQYFSSKLMTPALPKQTERKLTDQEEMTTSMQKQMTLLMPIMTLIIGLNFASGLVLYWVTFSLVMIAQQLISKNKKKLKIN